LESSFVAALILSTWIAENAPEVVKQSCLGFASQNGHFIDTELVVTKTGSGQPTSGTGGGQVAAATLNYVAKKLARYGKRLPLT
jgi:hypothetical protein